MNSKNEESEAVKSAEGDGSVIPALSADAQDNIGRQLRRHYGALVSEPLPDKLRDLLEKLAQAEPDLGAKS